jgi:hypothetical protein
MTTLMARKRIGVARDAPGWIGLAASPIFALMALVSATDAPQAAICAPAGDMPIHDMIWMYLLMSLFHMSPWLKLASRQPNHPTPQD